MGQEGNDDSSCNDKTQIVYIKIRLLFDFLYIKLFFPVFKGIGILDKTNGTVRNGNVDANRVTVFDPPEMITSGAVFCFIDSL